MLAVDERFLRQKNRERIEKKKIADRIEDDDEETLTYAPRTESRFINDDPGVFGSVFDESKSLNKAPSIFDATALFLTSKGESDE